METSIMISTTVISVVVGIVALFVWRVVSLRKITTTRVHAPSESAILITGGGRGIGKATAEYLSNQGYTVLVTVRKQADYDALDKNSKDDDNGGRILPVILDVTNDAHVQPAVERVQNVLKETNTKLIAIVNNAGINPEGDGMNHYYAEGKTPPSILAEPSVASRVLETNVVGVVRVTRAFLPLLLTSTNGGRIINIGSYFGSVAGKGGLAHAAYEASKFALEGLTDNMRRSLQAQNIHVSLIKPGNIQTDMNTLLGEVKADVVAQDIEHAIASPTPRPRYYPGKVKGTPCYLVCFLFEMLPESITDRI